MCKVSTILIFILSFYNTYSQPLFTKDSEIILEFDKSNKPYFQFNVLNDASLKVLCSLFKMDEKALRKANKLENKKVANNKVKIPIAFEKIVRSKTIELAKAGVYVPVYYFVKKGDTQYKLAKTYGKEDVEIFMKRNKLTDPNLKIDSKVNMGWLYFPNENKKSNEIAINKPSTIKEDKGKQGSEAVIVKKKESDSGKLNQTKKEVISKPNNINIASKNTDNKKLINSTLIKSEMKKDSILSDVKETEEVNSDWTNTKGIAYWQPSHRKSSGKYVLHSSAPINSIIKLYNPMMRRSVDAKVIGRIPKETYRKDVDIVISPAIAESLGALDSRFMVELTYKN